MEILPFCWCQLPPHIPSPENGNNIIRPFLGGGKRVIYLSVKRGKELINRCKRTSTHKRGGFINFSAMKVVIKVASDKGCTYFWSMKVNALRDGDCPSTGTTCGCGVCAFQTDGHHSRR